MDWGSIGKKIAGMGASILGDAIPFPGADDAITALAQELGVAEKPGAISDALDEDPEAQRKLEKIQNAHKQSLLKIRNEHKQEMREKDLQDAQGARSFAAQELESEDKYVRRTRPEMVRFTVKGGIAYIFLSTIALCTLSIFDVIGKAEADLLFELMKYQSGFVVGMIYMVFRTYTTRRSQDKAMERMGIMPEGLMDKAAKLMGKGK